MKKADFVKHFIIGLVLVVFMVGCSGSRHKASTGEYIDDSVITTKVKAEIFNDPLLKVFQINVETFKGVVQLSGFVNSEQASTRASKVARSVKGVTEVKNSLIIK